MHKNNFLSLRQFKAHPVDGVFPWCTMSLLWAPVRPVARRHPNAQRTDFQHSVLRNMGQLDTLSSVQAYFQMLLSPNAGYLTGLCLPGFQAPAWSPGKATGS